MKEFTMPVPVLHGVPTEYDVCIEWDAVDELETISCHIGQQCIQSLPSLISNFLMTPSFSILSSSSFSLG